jgi:hypothetical protein
MSCVSNLFAEAVLPFESNGEQVVADVRFIPINYKVYGAQYVS